MKAKLLKEQMGVPAGTEMEVVETGRAWTLRAPSGNEIVVPACDAEMVPDTEPFSEPKPVESDEPGDPETDPAARDENGNVVTNDPEPTEEDRAAAGGTDDPPEGTGEPESFDDVIGSPVFAADAVGTDDDLDEALPEPQGTCDGEGCEACQ